MESFVGNIPQKVSDRIIKDRPVMMERKFYLDLLRVIAISAVVMIHVSADYVVNPDNLIAFTIGNIFDSLSRLGVPLFLMISGALILDENKEFNCKKKIFSLLIPWFTWSFLYALCFKVVLPILKGESFSFLGFIANFIKGHFHLWYMWAIIGLYLITPILRKFVKIENKQIVAYFIVLSLLFQFTKPIITLLFEEVSFISKVEGTYTYIFENLNLDFLGGLTTYFLTGWFLSNINLKKLTVTILYIMGTVGLMCIIIFTQILPHQYTLTYSNSGLFVFFYSVAIFLLVKKMCSQCKSSNRVIIGLSNLSFGVYLIHMFVHTIVAYVLPNNPLFIPVIFLATIAISAMICYVISKIPIAKKSIRA